MKMQSDDSFTLGVPTCWVGLQTEDLMCRAGYLTSKIYCWWYSFCPPFKTKAFPPVRMCFSVEMCPPLHSLALRQSYLCLPAGWHHNNSRISPAKHNHKWMQKSVTCFFARTRPFTSLSSGSIETLFRNKMFSKSSMFNFHFLGPIDVVNILEVRKNTEMLKYCIFRGLRFNTMFYETTS